MRLYLTLSGAWLVVLLAWGFMTAPYLAENCLDPSSLAWLPVGLVVTVLASILYVVNVAIHAGVLVATGRKTRLHTRARATVVFFLPFVLLSVGVFLSVLRLHALCILPAAAMLLPWAATPFANAVFRKMLARRHEAES